MHDRVKGAGIFLERNGHVTVERQLVYGLERASHLSGSFGWPIELAAGSPAMWADTKLVRERSSRPIRTVHFKWFSKGHL
jgi:hypothetical protein